MAQLPPLTRAVFFSGPERTVSMFSRISRGLVNFLKNEDGPTAVEYAVMLALIIVVCVAAITTLGTNANATFTSVGNTIGSTSGS
jgi:pilus assembly protein Flp/PilA